MYYRQGEMIVEHLVRLRATDRGVKYLVIAYQIADSHSRLFSRLSKLLFLRSDEMFPMQIRYVTRPFVRLRQADAGITQTVIEIACKHI